MDLPKSNSGDGSSMESSPLLAKDSSLNPTSHSTIRPDMLDHSRFTDRVSEDEKGNAVRIIIYVVIVIAIGLGAALLVRNLITKNETEQADSSETDTTDTAPEFSSAYVVNKTVKADNLATNIAKNSDYIDSTILSLGTTDAVAEITLDEVRYDKYTTFVRTTFDMSGKAIPKTSVSFDSVKNMLKIKFEGLKSFDTELTKDAAINDLVKEIRFNSNDVEFIIFLSEESKYRVIDIDGDLILDIKTTAQLKSETDTETDATDEADEETDEEEDTTTDTTTDGDKPAAPHYTNEFSQNTQYVSSNVSGNTIAANEFYYEDSADGSFFELSWGQRNSVGDNFVPNAKSYLKTESGKEYLYVEISNLSQDVFKARGMTSTDLSAEPINLGGANFKRIELVSFTDGKSTYKIELKKKSNFKLLTQKTISGNTQVLSVQIKD